MLQLIGLFGGTFDPVHNGHLAIAKAVLNYLPMQEIRFIPSHIPVHRSQPGANALQRLEMLKLATKNHPHFIIDESEINRHTPSYSIDTLIEMRKKFPEQPLAWILGYDAWAQFHTWHRFKEILNYAHLIIASRPYVALQKDGIQAELLKQNQTENIQDLIQYKNGKIFILANCEFDISATNVRNTLKNNLNQCTAIPANVLNYILENNLYRKQE